MSHSVVKDFPTQTDSTLILVVNKNGELSVDKETLDGYAKLGNSQVSILRVDNDDGSTVDMTLDTFHQTDASVMETLTVNVEEAENELMRNYNSFRMDHCYTPLTSPSQQKPAIPPDLDSELELDDLAHTLSILDGSDKSSDQISPIRPVTNIVKVPQKFIEKEQRTETANDKVPVLNKVNKMGVQKVYKSVKTIVKSATKVFKKAEQLIPQLESDPDDDDLNDSDFELNESPAKLKTKRTYRRRSKQDNNEVNNEMRNKVVKIRKGMKHIVYKPHSPIKTGQLPLEPKPEPTPQTPVTPEPIKSPDVKKFPKKEKKIPKVVDDGIALFSTPDIIRRVGSGKPGEKVPESPESPPKIAKPAKIEDRSKSETGRLSTDTKIKSPHRHSLDSKIEKSKSDSKHAERRSSNASDKSVDNIVQNNTFDNSVIQNSAIPVTNNIPVQPPINIASVESHDESFDSISEAVGNLENDITPAPTVEMIRSIIHTSDTKTFSTPMETQNIGSSVINPIAPSVDQSQLNLEGTGLDIDQGILDNINTDELIPEDILYQVAKLVENPDVQNVIDRTLVDANLTLEPTIQSQIQQQAQAPTAVQQQPLPQPQDVSPISQAVSSPLQIQQLTKNTTQRPIQIVRSDGRVVILPPIEKPATRSSKKKQDPLPLQPQIQQPVQQQIQPQQQIIHPVPQQKIQQHVRPVLTKPTPGVQETHEEVLGSDIESDSDESWNSEDDPDRLWCICKQPHNNRFMICCDTCEDWFHGKCVNVTKAMGQQMEQQGKEWMCPNCVKKVNSPGVSISQPVTNIAPKAAKIPTDSFTKRKSLDSGPACIVCGAPSRANSVYCSDACILKHAQGVEKETNKAQKNMNQRIIVFERSTGKCLSGPNAPTAANLKQWLREHPGFEVVRPANKMKQNLVQSKLQLVKNPQGKEGIGIAVNRKGIQVGVIPHSSKQQQSTIKLIPAAKLNVPGMKNQVVKQLNQTSPTKPVKTIQTTLKSPTPTSAQQQKPKPTTPTTSKLDKTPRERKQKLQPNNQTPETPKQNALENIRDTVKKTLNEQLTTRIKEVEDIKLTEEEVDKMATDIEVQLYKLFGDSGPKYRTKYRSLIFNIKDTKNQTLWRRICEKTIAPAQLVRLTPDEMASQELARWRERENKHQLDMIKKSELEMLTINRTYVLKTHKGEQVMEDRPSVKVDSTEIMTGLGADSTSEQDTSGTGEKSEKDEHSLDRKSSSKHSRRDRDREKRSSKDRSISKDRRNNKDHKSSRSKRSRSQEKDRDRSSHRSERKRSRSRDRHHRSSHKSSRHRRDKHSTEHLDKKSREILDNLENNKIVPPPEDRLWKHVPQQDILVTTPDSDSDHEPSSTVTIPTPPRSLDQDESQIQAAKQIESVAVTEVVEKSEQKIDAPMKPLRADPRLTREASVETPKSESPQQPSTPTVSTSPVPPQAKFTSESKETIIWEGNINMVDVAKFFITLHEVSGDCSGLGTELPPTLEIVGRISPETVWEYIGKMRRSNSKLISVLRLTAGNVEEKMPYIALYSYLSSRSRFGVIKSSNNAVKDFYIMPLASHAPVPQALLPLAGPGFEESRPHLLLGIIVRAKRKRSNPVDIVANPTTKRSRLDSPSVNPPVAATQPARSYTPPPTRDPRIRLPTVPAVQVTNDDDEPYSPEDSDPELTTTVSRKSSTKTASTVTAAAASALSLKTADLTSLVTATLKSNAFLDSTTTVQSFEPFSNKFDAIPGLDVDTGVDSLQRKMAELDKCIEKQKEEIRSISQDIVSSGAAASMATNLSNISLPSNLQQILDSIKNIPSTNTNSQDASTEEYCPTAPGYKTANSASEELTIPLLLPKLSSRQSSIRAPITPQLSSAADQKAVQMPSTIPLQLPVAPRESTPAAVDLALPNLTVPPPAVPAITAATLPLPNTNVPPPVVLPNLNVPPPSTIVPSSSSTIPLNLPKPKPKPTPVTPLVVPLTPPGTTPVVIPPSVEAKPAEIKPASVLSSLSEEELIRKAAEMLGEAEPAPEEEEEEPEEQGKAPEKGYQTQNAFKSAPIMYSPTPVAPNPAKRTKIDVSQPPVPGLEDEY